MPVDDPLVQLLDEVRAGDEGAARVRERWLRRQAEEGATLVGTLLDLAERGTSVALRTASGRTRTGRVAAVGTDFVVLRSDAARDVCVRLSSVATVRPDVGAGAGAATGDRSAPLDLLLVEVVAGLAPERPRIALVTDGGELVAGELRSVGADVVTLWLDGDRRNPCYVAAPAVVEVVVERS